MRYHTTKVSRNHKTGPMPVMTSSRDTCPDSCPLKTGGCYAMTGPLKLHWDKVTNGERGTDLDEALKPIRKLNRGALWRYGQAGDLPGEGDSIDREGLMKIAAASRGKQAIIFTHKPATPENLEDPPRGRGEGAPHQPVRRQPAPGRRVWPKRDCRSFPCCRPTTERRTKSRSRHIGSGSPG